MSEPAENTEAPAPKKKSGWPKGKQRKKANVVPFKAPEEFAGMTVTECCLACKPDSCVISGVGICAHPNKGGLQPTLARDPSRLERYGRAQKALAQQKLDLRSV